jgi:hypothetical protein
MTSTMLIVGSAVGYQPPNDLRMPVGPGRALVGDGGLHQDPRSGLGIDQAMVQTTFVAEAVGARFGDGVP